MNTRAEAIKLLNMIPDDKMLFVVNILRNGNKLAIREVEPDELDLALLQGAAEDQEETISFQRAVKELGFDINEFQN